MAVQISPSIKTTRRRIGALVATFVLLGSACSSDSSEDTEASSPSTSTTIAEEVATTAPSSTTEAPAEPAEDDAPAPDDCRSVLSEEEINEIFQTTIVEINGSGSFCRVSWVPNAIGAMNTFSADDAEMWRENNSRSFDDAAERGGVLLEGGERGYIHDATVAVIGDSGRVYVLGVAEDADPLYGIAIPDGALERVAEIFLAK